MDVVREHVDTGGHNDLGLRRFAIRRRCWHLLRPEVRAGFLQRSNMLAAQLMNFETRPTTGGSVSLRPPNTAGAVRGRNNYVPA